MAVVVKATAPIYFKEEIDYDLDGKTSTIGF